MQPELFPAQSFPRAHAQRPVLFPHRFFRIRVAYEDLICVLLGVTLLLLAGFCLGVERGKKLTAAALHPADERVASPPPRELKVAQAAAKASSVGQGSYVIQLASYLDRRPAEQEALRLTRQGFLAQVVPQGRYFELRAGGFRSREEAMGPLAALRKTYHDGFVKRIASKT